MKRNIKEEIEKLMVDGYTPTVVDSTSGKIVEVRFLNNKNYIFPEILFNEKHNSQELLRSIIEIIKFMKEVSNADSV